MSNDTSFETMMSRAMLKLIEEMAELVDKISNIVVRVNSIEEIVEKSLLDKSKKKGSSFN